MQKATIYLSLAIAGVAVPLAVLVPWLAAHGLDGRLFLSELFINRVSSFFAADLLISACVVIAFALSERHVQRPWIVIAVVLLVGVSAGLPMLLYLQEKARTQEQPGLTTGA